jgi:hypothetical protein
MRQRLAVKKKTIEGRESGLDRMDGTLFALVILSRIEDRRRRRRHSASKTRVTALMAPSLTNSSTRTTGSHAIKAAFCLYAFIRIAKVRIRMANAPQRCIWLRTALAAANAALRNSSKRRTAANEVSGRTAIKRSLNVKRSRQM